MGTLLFILILLGILVAGVVTAWGLFWYFGMKYMRAALKERGTGHERDYNGV